jgi:diphosphomevalonate decarboxylase
MNNPEDEFLTRFTLLSPLREAVSAAWQSPSNIAIVKYWGKKGRQLPVNPSLSMTLSVARTETTLTALPLSGEIPDPVDFRFEGIHNPAFGMRIQQFIEGISGEFPFLKQVNLRVDSRNTFPHSAGIASSASAFSALALCICDLELKLTGKSVDDDPAFFERASYLSRLGSGSACRSVFGGWVEWGRTGAMAGSSDEKALPVSGVHPVFSKMCDAILLVSSSEKKVSSSMGHGRMTQHPFAQARASQANANTEALVRTLKEGDVETFMKITEAEALTLHALMMTSDPGFLLMEPESVRLMNRIREIREEEKLGICFTLDAGPNIHLLYFEKDTEQVQRLVVEDLIKNNKQIRWIDDRLGSGPGMI